MYELTGLDTYDWLVLAVGLGGLGLAVVAGFWGLRLGKTRWIVMGLGLAAMLLAVASQPERIWVSLSRAVTSLPALLVLAVLVLSIVGLMLLILRAQAGVSGGTMKDQRAPLVIGVLLLVASVGVFTLNGLAADGREPDATEEVDDVDDVDDVEDEDEDEDDTDNVELTVPPFSIDWTLDLAGNPVGLTFHRSSSSLYVSYGQGQIVRFEFDPGTGEVGEAETVADGLDYPRGIAALGDRLYVSEIGELPCESVFPRCKGENVEPDGDMTQPEGEFIILEASNGRVHEYAISADGSLSHLGILVDQLPVGNTDHAMNGMRAGDDGFLYLSIGGIDRLVYDLESFDRAQHVNKDLLGTLLRIDPSTGSHEVVARGMRNVFGIAIDPTGVAWGVDNDGTARGGFRFEEVLRIEEGADFGFPDDGSSPPFVRRTNPATYQLPSDVIGSGGVEWIENVDGQRGLLVGSAGRVSFLEMALVEGAYRVRSKVAFYQVMQAGAWVAEMERVSDTAVLVTEFGSNKLTLLTWDSDSED